MNKLQTLLLTNDFDHFKHKISDESHDKYSREEVCILHQAAIREENTAVKIG